MAPVGVQAHPRESPIFCADPPAVPPHAVVIGGIEAKKAGPRAGHRGAARRGPCSAIRCAGDSRSGCVGGAAGDGRGGGRIFGTRRWRHLRARFALRDLRTGQPSRRFRPSCGPHADRQRALRHPARSDGQVARPWGGASAYWAPSRSWGIVAGPTDSSTPPRLRVRAGSSRDRLRYKFRGHVGVWSPGQRLVLRLLPRPDAEPNAQTHGRPPERVR